MYFCLKVDFDSVFLDLTNSFKSTVRSASWMIFDTNLEGLTNLVLGNYQHRNEDTCFSLPSVAQLVLRPCIKPVVRRPMTAYDESVTADKSGLLFSKTFNHFWSL